MMSEDSQSIKIQNRPYELNRLGDEIRTMSVNGTIMSLIGQQCLKRFQSLLDQEGEDNGSIMLQDHWALLWETTGQWDRAIQFRRREIELINRLFELGGPVPPIDHRFLAHVQDALSLDLDQIANRLGGTT